MHVKALHTFHARYRNNLVQHLFRHTHTQIWKHIHRQQQNEPKDDCVTFSENKIATFKTLVMHAIFWYTVSHTSIVKFCSSRPILSLRQALKVEKTQQQSLYVGRTWILWKWYKWRYRIIVLHCSVSISDTKYVQSVCLCDVASSL